MEGAMKGAVGAAPVDPVETFGSPLVALAPLGPLGLPAESDPVRPQRRPLAEKGQAMRRLLDQDAIGPDAGGQRFARPVRPAQRAADDHRADAHDPSLSHRQSPDL